MFVVASFRRAQRLSAVELRLLAQALVLLPLTRFGIHVLGVNRWQHILSLLASLGAASNRNSNQNKICLPESALVRSHEAAAIQRAGEIARLVKIAAHHGVYQANCLQQALVLRCLLLRNCIESDIRFGARKQAGQLQAHAWVECFGIVLNEDADVCRYFSPFEGVAVAAQS